MLVYIIRSCVHVCTGAHAHDVLSQKHPPLNFRESPPGAALAAGVVSAQQPMVSSSFHGGFVHFSKKGFPQKPSAALDFPVPFDDLSPEFRHLGEIDLPAQVQGGKCKPLRVSEALD